MIHLSGLGKNRGGGLFETKDGMAKKFLELRYGSEVKKKANGEQGAGENKEEKRRKSSSKEALV